MPQHAIRSILAASDLGEASDASIQVAATLAEEVGATLHVVHAINPPSPYWEATTDAVSTQGWLHDGRRRLAQQVGKAVAEGTTPTQRVTIGRPFQVIEDRAKEVEADLIVLGPHRRRGAADGLLGTTADRVIRTSPIPCLVANGTLQTPLRRVLVPLDLSEPARGALDVAIAWLTDAAGRDPESAQRPEIEVLHVIADSIDPGGKSHPERRIEADLTSETSAALDRAGASAGLTIRPRVVYDDSPAEGILRTAGETDADLVVMGTHGYGAIRRALVGGVTSAVARRSPGPVLLVPPAMWRNQSARD